MKRLCLAVSFAALLPGCDVVSAVKLAHAEQNLRQECFGTYTNDCVSMTVDYNIMVIEQIQSQLLNQEGQFTEAFGDSDAGDLWVDHVEKLFEAVTETLENARPGFFARLFIGEAQPFDGRTVIAIDPSEMKGLAMSAVEDFIPKARAAGFELTDEARLKNRLAPEPLKHPATPPASDVAPPVANEPDTETLVGAINLLIETETSRDGGDEFVDARQVLMTDLNGDSYPDAAVLYTIEGQGGGNSAFQTLAVFYAGNAGSGEWRYQGSTVVYGAGTEMKSTEYRKISVTSLVHGPDDARCCPSIEGLDTYTWNGERFVEPENMSTSN